MVDLLLLLMFVNACWIRGECTRPSLTIYNLGISGSTIQFTCNRNGSTSDDILYKFWRDSTNVTSYQTGKSFLMRNVQTSASGNYSCSTKVNGAVGISVMKEVKVSLFAYLSHTLVAEGTGHNLTCYVGGSEVVKTFIWKENGVTLPLNSSILHLTHVSRNSNGRVYNCIAVKANGEKSNEASKTLTVFYMIQPFIKFLDNTSAVLVKELPGPPVNLSVIDSGENFITICWTKPKFDGNRPVERYEIQIKEIHASWNTSDNYHVHSVDRFYFKMSGLEAGVEYAVRLRAINAIGKGSFSKTFEVMTKPALVPVAPKDFKQALPALSRAIAVSWEPLNETVYDWILVYKLSDGTESADLAKLASSATSHTITSLDKFADYNLTLYARNCHGDGVESKLFNVYTREEEPENVMNVRIIEGQTHMVVTWKPPENIYGRLRGYKVCFNEISSSAENVTCRNVSSNTTAYNITNLQHNQEYFGRVTVFNSLFSSNGFVFKRKTIGLAPPPILSVPEPCESQVTAHTFTITIMTFNQTNGRIRHYDVILMPTYKNFLPSRQPNEYSNSEIENFVVGRLFYPENRQQFVIGNDDAFQEKTVPGSGRRRRALGWPMNLPLEPGTSYTVFVRGYVTDDVYQSTPWYKPIRTKTIRDSGTENSGLSNGVIAGIIIAVLAVVGCVLIAIFFLHRRWTSGGRNVTIGLSPLETTTPYNKFS